MRIKTRYFLLPCITVASLALVSLKNGNSFILSYQADGKDSAVTAELAKKAIYSDNFVRNTFYTWTSLDEVNQVRGNKVLLIKSKSETKGYSLFDLALRDSTFGNNPVAKVLCEDRFAKKRFAWPNPWATVMGWEEEKYGNQLIKIVLKPDAIMGKFDERDKKNPFAFYDMKGNKIEIADAMLQKEKIAAIYHIGMLKSVRTEKFIGTYVNSKNLKPEQTSVTFREYVILNKDMIKFWAYGTDDIITELNDEVALLDKVADNCKDAIEGAQFYNLANKQYYDWERNDDFTTNYFDCICFENDFYLLNKKRINAIISTLKKCVKAQAQPITGN